MDCFTCFFFYLFIYFTMIGKLISSKLKPIRREFLRGGFIAFNSQNSCMFKVITHTS